MLIRFVANDVLPTDAIHCPTMTAIAYGAPITRLTPRRVALADPGGMHNCPPPETQTAPPQNPQEKKWKITLGLGDQGKIFAAAFGGQNSENTLKLTIFTFIFKKFSSFLHFFWSWASTFTSYCFFLAQKF